jgi:hypothetical protein
VLRQFFIYRSNFTANRNKLLRSDQILRWPSTRSYFFHLSQDGLVHRTMQRWSNNLGYDN